MDRKPTIVMPHTLGEEGILVPKGQLTDSHGNPLKSAETIKEEVAESKEGQMAAALQSDPRFRKMRKKFEKALKNLERHHPNMAPSERMQLAAKIVLLS